MNYQIRRKEAKESESLSEEEFEKKYGSEFEICKTLGEHGWVVSGHSNPRYIKNWYKALIESEPDKIVWFFEEDDDRVIKNIMDTLESKYNDPVNRNWLLHGKCCREIERFECIQLLNALETIENVLGNEKEIESQ